MTFYIGPAGAPLGCTSTEEGIRRVSELGLNLMEVEFVQGVRMNVASARGIRKTAEQYNVRLSCHAPYFINLNAKEEEKLKRSRHHILSTMEVAHALGAYIIAFHAGFYLGMDKESVYKKIHSELSRLVEESERNGWNDVLLGLETTGKHSAWGDLMECVNMSREFKNVVPVIDFAHLYARSNGQIRTTNGFEDIITDFEKGPHRFLHSHFSCIKYSEKGELRHLSMEESNEPDFTKLAPVLAKRKYDISIVCESPLLDRDALKIQKILNNARK